MTQTKMLLFIDRLLDSTAVGPPMPEHCIAWHPWLLGPLRMLLSLPKLLQHCALWYSTTLRQSRHHKQAAQKLSTPTSDKCSRLCHPDTSQQRECSQ